jgi:ATP-dependent protease ClpP protease subunit
MKNKLRALLASNAKRGSFRAEGNTIYVYDMIVSDDFEAEWMGGVSPAAFIEKLSGLSGDVAVRINSPGGDVMGAVAMCQAMREYAGTITVHVDGWAASAASVLAVAAPKVVMAPGSFMMIHKAWTIGIGNSDDMLATAELLEKVDGSIAESYAAKAGGDAAPFLELMAKETWFTAAEAVEARLADEVAGDKPKAMGRWDLSAFAAAPPVEPDERPTEPTIDDTIDQRVRQHAARMLERSA